MTTPSQTILLAEDDDLLRQVIEITLREAGYRVVACQDGEEAWQCLNAVRPDIIVSDIVMPRVDGLELLQRVRTTPRWAMLPFIALTAKADTSDLRAGMSAGADDYVPKPFDPADLLRTITLRLQRARAFNETSEAHQRFLSRTLAHELRTPLSGIIGFAELLLETASRRGVLQGQELTTYGEGILHGGMRLLRIAESFELWAQFEIIKEARRQGGVKNQLAVSISPPDIERRCRQVAASVGREADLQPEIEAGVVSVPVRAIEHVLSHLVENGFAFSKPGSVVRVRGRTENGSYRFSVSDRGLGMTSEQIQQVGGLRQFGRETNEQQGIGLGLALAGQLAELSGGGLEIRANPEGSGLEVTLRLPLAHAKSPVVLPDEMPVSVR